MIQSASNVQNKPDSEGLKGWHVLLIMLGFFGVMFSANGVFLYHAITSFPGEDVKKSYVQGLNYNQTLARRAAQTELGWSAEAGLSGGQILMRLQARDGEPVSDQIVIGELRRLTTRKQDLILAFQPGPGGIYTASGEVLAPGQWLLRVSVMDAQGETVQFEIEKVLLVS